MTSREVLVLHPTPPFCAARRERGTPRLRVLDGKLDYVLRVYLVLRRGATYVSIYNGISRTKRSLEHFKEGGPTEGNGDSLETAPREVRERGTDLSSRSEVASGITAQRRRRIAAAGDESRTVRITAAKMTRGEWVGGLNHIYFCRDSNFGGTRGSFAERQRELHAASSVAAELTPFSSRSLSFFFFPFSLPPPSFPWFAGSARGGRRRQVGEEGELLRRAASDRGPRVGPMPCAWLGGLP